MKIYSPTSDLDVNNPNGMQREKVTPSA